jgi:arylsulfatase A-like enzyme
MLKNILIIHTDQQRYDSLGCSGNPHAATPNIDKLAAEGSFFSRHISSNPICMPSRASLMTGLYPPGHGVYTNGVPLNRKDYASPVAIDHGVFVEPMTMADMFANAGYDTASFGKLHLTPTMSGKDSPFHESRARYESGELDDWHGPYYGFRYVDMTKGHGEAPCLAAHYSKWLREKHPETYKKVVEQKGQKECPLESQPNLYPSPVPFEQSCTAWLAKRFNEYITEERPQEKPFFAFVGFPDPHHPFTPSYDILEKFTDSEVKPAADPEGHGIKNNPVLKDMPHRTESESHRQLTRRYTNAMVHQIDIAVGRIINTLKENGLWDNTIIVFTSDHGDFLGDHGLLLKAQAASDALLHIPFILRAPKSDIPHKTDIPMSNCDVMPTLAALAGVEPPRNLHGKNICEALHHKNDYTALAFCADGNPENVNYTVYDRYLRFTWYPHSGYQELFDHYKDPEESHNIADSHEYRTRTEKFMAIIKSSLADFYNPILQRICPW